MTDFKAMLMSLCFLAALCVASILALEIGRPSGYNNDALYKAIEICGGTMAAIVLLLKSHVNTKAIADVKEEVKKTGS